MRGLMRELKKKKKISKKFPDSFFLCAHNNFKFFEKIFIVEEALIKVSNIKFRLV